MHRLHAHVLRQSHCESLLLSGLTLRLDKWEGIFQSGKSQGILNRLEKSENHTKYWKPQGISDKYNLSFFSDI